MVVIVVALLCLTPCEPMDCSTPGFPVHHCWSLLKLTSIELTPSNHFILCCPLLILPSTFPSIRVFSNESTLLIRWPKYWSFRIRTSYEYLGLISIKIYWFYLLAVQELSRIFSDATNYLKKKKKENSQICGF